MSIFYILLLFACLGVVASHVAELSKLSVHKDIGWKDAGSTTNLTIEEAEHIAKFQSFAAPDGEVAQNQTDEEAEHIAEYYIDVFNKLVKVKNSTELALYFSDQFKFYACTQDETLWGIDTADFLKLLYTENANWKLKKAEFMKKREKLIFLILDMNMFGYVEVIKAWLEKHEDGSWQWFQVVCREKKCVNPKNT